MALMPATKCISLEILKPIIIADKKTGRPFEAACLIKMRAVNL